MFYIVFGSTKRPLMGGGSYVDWQEKPLGVYGADNPDDACKAAAAETNHMGTFVAVACHVWGVEMMETGATRLGSTPSAIERMEARLAARDEQITKMLEQRNGG